MPRKDAEFYDREYNARLAVPDHPAIFARWRDDSREVRRRCAGLIDLPYGESPAERLDLFPAAGEGSPLLVFIHGGYWRALDKSDFSWVAPPFLAAGASVAVVNYALLPSVRFETLVMQNVAALAWLHRNAERYHFDPRRIVVSGHSAGGHLAAMMLCALWPTYAPDLPADLVKGAVAISGLFDLHPLTKAPFLSADLGLDGERATNASPALLRPATGAPLVTAVGGDESSEFHRQERLIAQRWPRGQVSSVAMPGTNHMTVVDRLADPASPLHEATLRLLRA